MRMHELSGWSLAAMVLGGVGFILGIIGLLSLNPFLQLAGLTIVCTGGVSALIGLQGRDQ